MTPSTPLSAGRLNWELADAVVRIHCDHSGRGPARTQAFFRYNVVVVLMGEVSTKVEQSLVDGGREDLASEVRREFERSMRSDLVEAVEHLTGCRVVAFLDGNHVGPDLVSEVYVLDRSIVTEESGSSGAPELR